VLQRASQTLEWATQGGLSLLTRALEKLSLGRAYLLLALSAVEGQATVRTLRAPGQSFSQAEDFLNQAVTGLRESGEQIWICRGLLDRAALYRVQGEFAKASAISKKREKLPNAAR